MTRSAHVSSQRRAPATPCIDPVVGDILSGWRYDISGLSPAMRTDYEDHLIECGHCRSKQRLHRTVDVLLISVTSLSILAFLLAALVMHRVEALTHVAELHVHLRHTAMYVSLEAVAIIGLLVSSLLWVLVAIATPLPGFLGDVVQSRLPADLLERIQKDRISKNAA
jgi:hypothetical protein